jgi:hypothetical protein
MFHTSDLLDSSADHDVPGGMMRADLKVVQNSLLSADP